MGDKEGEMRPGKLLCLSWMVLVLFASVGYGAADRGGDGPQAVVDSSSTFDIGNLAAVFPLDTVMVPVYLNGPSDVTQVYNQIGFADTALTLLGVLPGEALPAGVGFFPADSVAGTLLYDVHRADQASFTLGSGPIAWLQFQVQCFGYGATTAISFVNGDLGNFYVSGIQYSPLRDDGSITTAVDQYPYMSGRSTNALVGQHGVEFPITYNQGTPGRPVSVVVQFDNTVLEWVDVLPGDDLGGTVTSTYLLPTMRLLEFSSGLLPAGGGEHEIARVVFNLLTSDDGYSSYVNLDSGMRENACLEQLPLWYSIGNSIHVPLHTASADVGTNSHYYTATEYTVPFIIDSNHPVDSYKLFFHYPDDSLTFDGTTDPLLAAWGIDQSTTPWTGWVETPLSGDPLDPALLGQAQFSLKFTPIGSYGSGTRFHFRFNHAAPDYVRYVTDGSVERDATITALTPGYITLTTPGGGGGPCCPALYAWDGAGFVLENTVLARCDGRSVSEDITDYYLMTRDVVVDNGKVRFQISENADAVSRFRDLELMIFDRPVDQEVHLTDDGTIVAANAEVTVKWARDHTGRDITELIESSDDVVYQSTSDGWFEVSLGVLSRTDVANFVANVYDAKKKSKLCDELLRAQGVDLEDTKLKISVRNAKGTWTPLAEGDARHNVVPQSILIDPNAIPKRGELVLRYEWEGHYRADVVKFQLADEFQGSREFVSVSDAFHTEMGSVRERMGTSDADRVVTLESGQSIDLTFDIGHLRPVAHGFEREYVFVTTGRYNEAGPVDGRATNRGWALDANVPNPFNPSTTIHYNLARATSVSLAIYDVRGALVRTLVSGNETAGEKEVQWDGLSNRGQPLASGVYFYRLQTNDFVQTRKMLLLK